MFFAVKIGQQQSAVKFGKSNLSNLAEFRGEEAQEYALEFADFLNAFYKAFKEGK